MSSLAEPVPVTDRPPERVRLLEKVAADSRGPIPQGPRRPSLVCGAVARDRPYGLAADLNLPGTSSADQVVGARSTHIDGESSTPDDATSWKEGCR